MTHFRAPQQSTLILFSGDERAWFAVAETRRDEIFHQLEGNRYPHHQPGLFKLGMPVNTVLDIFNGNHMIMPEAGQSTGAGHMDVQVRLFRLNFVDDARLE